MTNSTISSIRPILPKRPARARQYLSSTRLSSRGPKPEADSSVEDFLSGKEDILSEGLEELAAASPTAKKESEELPEELESLSGEPETIGPAIEEVLLEPSSSETDTLLGRRSERGR